MSKKKHHWRFLRTFVYGLGVGTTWSCRNCGEVRDRREAEDGDEDLKGSCPNAK